MLPYYFDGIESHFPNLKTAEYQSLLPNASFTNTDEDGMLDNRTNLDEASLEGKSRSSENKSKEKTAHMIKANKSSFSRTLIAGLCLVSVIICLVGIFIWFQLNKDV